MSVIHSYSSLAAWKQCPRHYKARYVDKILKYTESPAAARGNRLHKDMEKVLEKGAPPPPEYKADPRLLDVFRAAEMKAEVPLALTRDGRGCQFFDNSSAWLRGKIDGYKGLPERRAALMVDWKTGNPRYFDPFQADVYTAIVTSSTTLEWVLFVWVYFSGETPSQLCERDASRRKVFDRIEAVEADTEFAPKPSWKCRFCELTSCEYNTSGG